MKQWELLFSNQYRFEWILWRWLRLRSRARHVVAALLNRQYRLLGKASKRELDDETAILGRIQQLIIMHRLEDSVPILSFTTPEKIGLSIKSQLEERRISDHIEEALDFEEVVNKRELIVKKWESPLIDAIIARCEARAVVAELHFAVKENDAFYQMSQFWNYQAEHTRRLDSELSQRIRSDASLKNRLRGFRNLMFPHKIPKPTQELRNSSLLEALKAIGISDSKLICSKEMPWLFGKEIGEIKPGWV